MHEESAIELVLVLVVSVLLVIPTWRIFRRAGLGPAWSLLIFVPYMGLWVAYLMLSFRRWPAIPTVARPAPTAPASSPSA